MDFLGVLDISEVISDCRLHRAARGEATGGAPLPIRGFRGSCYRIQSIAIYLAAARASPAESDRIKRCRINDAGNEGTGQSTRKEFGRKIAVHSAQRFPTKFRGGVDARS